jgi:hypothetical protein
VSRRCRNGSICGCRSRGWDRITYHVKALSGFGVAGGYVAAAVHARIPAVDTPAAVVVRYIVSNNAATFGRIDSTAGIVIHHIFFNEVTQPLGSFLPNRNALRAVAVGCVVCYPVLE